MKLNINTTQRRVYRQVLEIIRSIPPLDTLRNRELDVLSVYMYFNARYKNLEPDIRWRIINDAATKKEMQEELGMSEDVLNNNISLVRKTGLIDKKTGRLHNSLQLIINDNFEIIFNFNVGEDEL